MGRNSWEIFKVPKRASYIRVILLELSRIASHLLWLGPFMADIGAQTPFFYIFRERELVYDLFEAATGMRMMHNFFRIGGVAADLPHGWIDKCLDFCDYFLTRVTEYQKLITRNPIFLERVEGVGVVGAEEAINWGLSGPMLRASGVQWDLRKVDHYESYDEFDWEVPWQKEGDSLARYLVRIGEMTESITIIQQALERIPGGPYENLETRHFDRERHPEWDDFEYRFISFINLQILPQLIKRMKLADIMDNKVQAINSFFRLEALNEIYGISMDPCPYFGSCIGNYDRCTSNCMVRKRNIRGATTTYWT
ncbi:NAD(P)H-quinone oxidoreductase subunit H, chloroplastic [Linum perenne]